MTEKRYQAFVSSTYVDLVEARSEVMQALLELDCMPAGMELFPAANDDQWKWIRRIIDESDYYIVVVAGRYGSVSKATGLSYTEMEYRYALEIQKPVIAFVHDNPAILPNKFSESTEMGQVKLQEFRDLVQKKLCKFWSNPQDLGAKVSRSLTQLIKQHPAVGWVRSDTVDVETARDAFALRKQVDELTEKLRHLEGLAPRGTELLSSGDELVSLEFYYEVKVPKTGKLGQTYFVKGSEDNDELSLSWDELFKFIAPHLLEPLGELHIGRGFGSLVEAQAMHKLEIKHPNCQITGLSIYDNTLKSLIIQFRALGLVDLQDGKWSLTDYGDAYMTRLLAIPSKKVAATSKAKGR